MVQLGFWCLASLGLCIAEMIDLENLRVHSPEKRLRDRQVWLLSMHKPCFDKRSPGLLHVKDQTLHFSRRSAGQ